MPWVKLDDEFPEHDKIARLSHGAFRLHVAGLCNSSHRLSDGLIEAHRVPQLMPQYKPAYLTELVKGEVWHLLGDAYVIHDFLDFNWSREGWERQRAKAKERKDKWRKGRRENDG